MATPPPQAARPPLRDFDQSPPPFAAAGAADVLTTATGPPAPPPPSSPAGRLTILLTGIDQRPDEAVAGGDPGRTDSMVLVSIDYDAHTASMVSIPRDGFVVIFDHGNERVNAAYGQTSQSSMTALRLAPGAKRTTRSDASACW